VYNRILDLKIASPQIIFNYGLFLEENNYFEEAFKVNLTQLYVSYMYIYMFMHTTILYLYIYVCKFQFFHKCKCFSKNSISSTKNLIFCCHPQGSQNLHFLKICTYIVSQMYACMHTHMPTNYICVSVCVCVCVCVCVYFNFEYLCVVGL